jgi:uncharacterized membrane protein (DUF2068 family)
MITQHKIGKHPHPVARRRALRTIGMFEAVKGIAALLGSIGLLSLVHHDVRKLMLDLIEHLGLDPDAHYPTILLQFADTLHGVDMLPLLFLAICYASLRFIEAYGLWHNFAWGEWLGALSGAIYIPLEIRHIAHKLTVPGVAVFACNVLIVLFLALQLWNRHRRPQPIGKQ